MYDDGKINPLVPTGVMVCDSQRQTQHTAKVPFSRTSASIMLMTRHYPALELVVVIDLAEDTFFPRLHKQMHGACDEIDWKHQQVKKKTKTYKIVRNTVKPLPTT